jgi:hypothetical protein
LFIQCIVVTAEATVRNFAGSDAQAPEVGIVHLLIALVVRDDANAFVVLPEVRASPGYGG